MCCTVSHVTGAVDFAPLPESTRRRFAEAVVTLTHEVKIAFPVALDWLAAARLTADDCALEDALVALQVRDGLLAGFLDPYEASDAVRSVPAEKARDYAVEQYDRRAADAVRVLAQPADVTGARAVLGQVADTVLAGAR